MHRNFELVHKENALSRLTVTPTRVTLKVIPSHKGIEDDLIGLSLIMADQIDHDKSLRGTFDWDQRNIVLREKTGKVHCAFTWDGRTGTYTIEKSQ